MTLLVAIAGLLLLVALHEAGHALAGRALGLKLDRFAIGLGPALVSVRRGDTQFLVCAFPLGGYVRFRGMEHDEGPGSWIAAAAWRRAIVFAAGPLASALAALVLVAAGYMLIGPQASNEIAQVDKGSAAAHAGLAPRQRITAADGQPVKHGNDIASAIERDRGGQLQLMVDGRPVSVAVPRKGVIGVVFARSTGLAAPAAVKAAANELGLVASMTAQALAHMLHGNERDLSGPVGIAQVTQQAVGFGVGLTLVILGVVSFSLALLNLVPLPPLDGGQLLLSLIEWVRRRPLPASTAAAVTFFGVGVLLLVFLFGLRNDLGL